MIRREYRKLSAAEVTLKFYQADLAARAVPAQEIPTEMPLVGGSRRRSSLGYRGRNQTRPVGAGQPAPEPTADGSDQRSGDQSRE